MQEFLNMRDRLHEEDTGLKIIQVMLPSQMRTTIQTNPKKYKNQV